MAIILTEINSTEVENVKQKKTHWKEQSIPIKKNWKENKRCQNLEIFFLILNERRMRTKKFINPAWMLYFFENVKNGKWMN